MSRVAVVGEGRHVEALRAHAVPLGGVEWSGVEPADGILAFGDIEAALAGLRAGKAVLCPPVWSRGELERLASAGNRLLAGGEIAYSQAGAHGLATIRNTSFGAVKSVYLAIRQARGEPGDLRDVVAEALDFVMAILPGGFPAVRVNKGALFGPAVDTVVLVLRSSLDVVVTLEVSRCLPAGLVLPGLGEVEIEVMGAAQSVRITPGSDAVQIWRDGGRRLAPWLDAPVLGMVRAAADGTGEDGLERGRRIVEVMERASLSGSTC